MPDISKVNIDEFSYSSNTVNSSTSGGSASSTPSTPKVKAQDVNSIVKYAKKRKKDKEQEKKRQIREQKKLERERKQAEKQARYDALSTKDKLKKQTQWLKAQLSRIDKNDKMKKMIGDRYETYSDKLKQIKDNLDDLSESQMKLLLANTQHMRELSSMKGLKETISKRVEGMSRFFGDSGNELKLSEIEKLEDELAQTDDKDKKSKIQENIDKIKHQNTQIKFEYNKKKDEFNVISGDTITPLSYDEVSEFWRLFRDAYDDSWLTNLKNYDKGEEGVNTVFDEFMKIKDKMYYANDEAYIRDKGEEKTVGTYLHDKIQEIVEEEQKKEKAMLKKTEDDFKEKLLKDTDDEMLKNAFYN